MQKLLVGNVPFYPKFWYPLICPGIHLSGGSLVRELGVRVRVKVRVRVRQSRQVVVRRHRAPDK